MDSTENQKRSHTCDPELQTEPWCDFPAVDLLGVDLITAWFDSNHCGSLDAQS